MLIGHKYKDVMDESRHVVPINADGLCRVFFDRRYVGNAPVPPKLFDDTGTRNYTGFVLDEFDLKHETEGNDDT